MEATLAPRFEIEDVPAQHGGGHVVRRTLNGVTVEHVVRPGDEAFAAVASLSASFVEIGEADEAALLEEVERLLGFRDNVAAEVLARAADRPATDRQQNAQQKLAWRVEALGFSREGRLALASRVLNRTVESYGDLTWGECVRVWEAACSRVAA